MGNKINIDTWKTKLNPSPNDPNISVVSLYDLFFYENEEGIVSVRTIPDSGASIKINKGLRLDHDIIAYDPTMYNQYNGSLDLNKNGIENLWFDKGFDIAIPQYDKRAVKKFLPVDNKEFCGIDGLSVNSKEVPKNRDVFKDVEEGTLRSDLFDNKEGYWIYDKESILQFETVEAFTQNSITLLGSETAKNKLKTLGLTDSYGNPEASRFIDFFREGCTPISVLPGNENGVAPNSATLYVAETDIIFEETMSTTNQNTPKLLIAPGRTEALYLMIYEILGLTSTYTPSLNDFFNSFVSVVTTTSNESEEHRKSLITALKNNYVLIRCSFFADYVDPDNFNQNLNQTSNVEFGNLYIKNSVGDFFRYDTAAPGYIPNEGSSTGKTEYELIQDNHKAILTRAFMPQTSPIVDLASDAIYKEGVAHTELDGYETPGTNVPGVQGTIKEKFIRLIDSGDWPNTPIGSIYIDPISKESHEALEELYDNSSTHNDSIESERLKNIGNPSYFDPESRKDVEDYTLEEWERLPTLIHKRGNIQIDGRVLSVTTDELWTAIKKIILGRRPDIDSTSIDLVDEGIPFNSDVVKSNDKDTRLFEVTNNEFKFLYDKDEQSKKGDPIRVSIAPNENNKESLIVEMFVNNNDSIKYTIYEAIHRLDESVTEWDRTSDDIEEKQRSIRKFTPWKVNVRTSEEGENVPENNIDTGDEWKPRKVPFSLRELEAGVLQNKYNIIALARYLKENFMVSGQLGRVYVNKMPYGSEDNVIENNSAGSLYQSHKDYNYVVDDPNTYFDINRENKIDNQYSTDDLKNLGRGAIFSDGDYRGLIEYKTDDFNSRYDEAVYSTGQRYHSINGYEPSEVYMAADGTWRYIHDHVRSPILKTKY